MNEHLKRGRWQANENFILRTIAGESVLIPVGNVHDSRFDNCMITMNETAAFLWRLFSDAPRTEEEAIMAAEESFSAPEGAISGHIRAFIAEYATLGLLHKEKEYDENNLDKAPGGS